VDVDRQHLVPFFSAGNDRAASSSRRGAALPIRNVELAVSAHSTASAEAGNALVIAHLQRQPAWRVPPTALIGVVKVFKAAGASLRRGSRTTWAPFAGERDRQRIADAARAASDERNAGGERFWSYAAVHHCYAEATASEVGRTCCLFRHRTKTIRRRRIAGPGL